MKQLTANNEIDLASLHDLVLKECLAMAKHILVSGKKLPPGTMETIQSFAASPECQNAKDLIPVHEKLAEIIAPASPKTIVLLEMESAKRNRLKSLGLIPLIRQLSLVAIISLIVFIFCQSFEIADTTLDVMDQSGLQFLLIIITLVASAGMGASFVSLFQANKYITAGTYDPKYESSYWARFILGIIAGVILSVLIPIGKGGQAGDLGRPLLAMLGGFSANLVYRILTRLAESVESLITGSKEEGFAAKEKELNVRAMKEDFRVRQEAAAGLSSIVQQIDPQMDPQQIKDKLQAFINDIYLKNNSGKEPAETAGAEPESQADNEETEAPKQTDQDLKPNNS
jgi:hypothetical protein